MVAPWEKRFQFVRTARSALAQARRQHKLRGAPALKKSSMKSALRLFPIHVAAATLLFISAGRAQEVTIDQVADQPFITLSSEEASDFSGLTWRGEDNYVAVSDKHRALFPLRLRVDRATGRILEGSFGAKIPIQTALGDFEGIALGARRLFVSAESGNGIFSVNPDGGDYRALKVPKIFTKTRPNKGLESLTYGAGTFWTANEKAARLSGFKNSTPRSGLLPNTLIGPSDADGESTEQAPA